MVLLLSGQLKVGQSVTHSHNVDMSRLTTASSDSVTMEKCHTTSTLIPWEQVSIMLFIATRIHKHLTAVSPSLLIKLAVLAPGSPLPYPKCFVSLYSTFFCVRALIGSTKREYFLQDLPPGLRAPVNDLAAR